MPKPKPNESKQDFLRRCSGGDESKISTCAAAWNRVRMSAYESDNRLHLTGDVQMQDQQAEDGPARFGILAYTGALIDWGWVRFIIALDGMKMAKDKIPSLLNHNRTQIVGNIDTSSTGPDGFVVSGSFSKVTDAAREVRGLAEEEFPWQASIGVEAKRILQISEGDSYTVNGQVVDGPVDVFLESEIFEVSFCPFGADDNTAAIAMEAGGAKHNLEVSMNKELRKLLEKLGLPATASDNEAMAFMAELSPEQLAGVELEQKQPKDGGKTAADPVNLNKPAQPSQPAQSATTAELSAKDLAELQQRGALLGLGADDVTKALGKMEMSKDAALASLFELAEKKAQPLGSGRLEMGADASDKLRLAARDGLLFRLGNKVDQPAAGHEDFRYASLMDIGKMCLEAQGVNTRGMSKRQLAGRIMNLSHTTSDFPAIFSGLVNVRLLKAYQEAPATWRPWCNITSASDFRDNYGVALSAAPELQKVNEAGEFKNGTLSESKEGFRLATYGRTIQLTRQMLINDDLRAFDRLATMFGASARRLESNLVYDLLLSNPKMQTDNTAMFAAAHKNLEGAADNKGVVTSSNLSAARAAMRKQKGMAGETLNIMPQFLLVPVEQETSAEILLRSTALPEDGKSAGVYNPFANKLTPIAEPRLDAVSTKAWYLVGDPSQIDTIEVAYLDGEEQPYIEEQALFEKDAVGIKVRHDFGCGVMDFRGFFKNPGA